MQGFGRKCIDRLEEINLETLKAEDLKWQFGTGQAISAGWGRGKPSYRHGVQTPIGDIELSVWIRAAEYVVERDGLQEEVKRMTPYCCCFSTAGQSKSVDANNVLVTAQARHICEIRVQPPPSDLWNPRGA